MLAGQNGARGQSCTDTGDALNVVPLLVGLHEQTSPAGLFHRLNVPPWRNRLIYFALGDVKMVGVPGNAPGPGTDLVRFRL